MQIQILKPIDNGGARIQGYIIQSQNHKTGEWESEVPLPIVSLVYRIQGLENEVYSFRVISVNKYGEGKPGKVVTSNDPLSEEYETQFVVQAGDGVRKASSRATTPTFNIPDFLQMINTPETKIPFRSSK